MCGALGRNIARVDFFFLSFPSYNLDTVQTYCFLFCERIPQMSSGGDVN